MRILPLPVLFLLVGCGGGADSFVPPIPASDPALLEAIGAAEDQRDASSPAITNGVTSPDPKVRRRAAVALGHILTAECIDPLVKLCHDDNPLVKRSAVFSAGQFGLDASLRRTELLQAVTKALGDTEETVRVRAVEACGKLGLEAAPALVLPFLQERSVAVRSEVVMAIYRSLPEPVRRRKEKAAALSQATIDALTGAAADKSPEVRWRTAYVAAQLEDPRLGSVLRDLTKDAASPWSRMYAASGLGRLKDKSNGDATGPLQADAEGAVRCAAVRSLIAMERQDLASYALVKDPSLHVRTAIAQALGKNTLRDEEPLRALLKDESVQVQSAALISLVTMSADKARSDIAAALASRHPALRSAGVEAAQLLGTKGISLLEMAQEDRDENVRAKVVEIWGAVATPAGFKVVQKALKSPGVAERGTAVETLATRKEPEVVDEAIACYNLSLDRKWIEARETLADILGKRGTGPALAFLKESCLKDAAPSVRNKAIEILKARGESDLPATTPIEHTVTPYIALRFNRNPVVVLETNRGVIEIEGYAREAPVHVANFVGLAEDGKYNGLKWHRVISNFVIQGGDPMGNGWGDAGWHLRHEFNEIPFERGTLGMPRSAGLDTGGCQLFITHVPTPHLTAQYTVFGKVVKGLDVIDKVEVGDFIKKVTVRR